MAVQDARVGEKWGVKKTTSFYEKEVVKRSRRIGGYNNDRLVTFVKILNDTTVGCACYMGDFQSSGNP